MKKYVILSLLLLSASIAMAQSGMLKGKVTDAEGEPLPGVTVVIKGTTKGVVSDIDGNYSFANIPAGSTLQFSFVGMLSQEVEVGSQSTVNIAMKVDAIGIDEVVAVGYGVMKKSDLTGSVISVNPSKIENENPKTVQDILRGVPGLNVGLNTSAKGGGTMKIRGERSVYSEGGHSNPLLILDGMLFYGELSEINPDDIEQIEVLKDASSAAVYGAKAANGVIMITTKKGKKGKPVINVNSSVGFSQLSDYRERWTPDQYMQHYVDYYETSTYGLNSATGEYEAYQVGDRAGDNGYYRNPNNLPDGVSLDQWRAYSTNQSGESDASIWAKRIGIQGNLLENFLNGKTTDWYDHTYRVGFNQDYNASISGAGDNVNYYFSMGYLDNQGVSVSDDYSAIRANMKINANATDWLEIGANVNFQDRTDGALDISIDESMRNSPYADYYDADGTLAQFPNSSEYSQRGYNYDFQKQYLALDKGYTIFNSILTAKVKLPFNITYSFNASPRFQYFHDRWFSSAELPGSNPVDRGVNREQAKRYDWSLNNTINWDQTFNDKHHFIVTLVQEAEKKQYWSDRIEARNILPSDALGYHNTQSGSKENTTYRTDDSYETADALMARLFYSYNEKYMVTTSIRRDGYSAFGGSNPYATFPSVALAWTFTNEDFFKWSAMSRGKMRFSYGKNGNRSLANPYLALANLTTNKMHGYLDSAGEMDLYTYLYVSRLPNPNLKWETTESFNLGLDFGFLDNRVSGSLDFYTMNTNDMVMPQRLPNYTGFSSITTNLGQVNNRGFELAVNTINIDNNDLRWTTTFGFAYNKNEIKRLYGEYEDVLDAAGNVIGSKEMDDISNRWFIGESIGAIWNYEMVGIWQKNEVDEAEKYGQRPGDPKIANRYTADDVVNADGSVTHVYNDNDKVILGHKTPPITWSMRNEFVFREKLSFSFNIYSYMGHKSTSGNYLNKDDDGGRMTNAAANKEVKIYWTIDNPTNEFGRINALGPNGATSAPKLYNRSFIRLENISIGYELPKRWYERYQIERFKVFGAVRNVAVWAKDWPYGDPETGGSASRIYTFGANIAF